jgi:hypothetical protein
MQALYKTILTLDSAKKITLHTIVLVVERKGKVYFSLLELFCFLDVYSSPKILSPKILFKHNQKLYPNEVFKYHAALNQLCQI